MFLSDHFFPELIRKVNTILPGGISLKLMQSALTGYDILLAGELILYAAILFGIALLIRERRIRA